MARKTHERRRGSPRLKGERTGNELYVLLWRKGLASLNEHLNAFDYHYDRVQIVNRYEGRIALVEKICGLKGCLKWMQSSKPFERGDRGTLRAY